MSPDETKLIELTDRLLDAISGGDWPVYSELCDPSLSCFEPEARGHLVQGMPFHKFYFELGGNNPGQTTIASPHVRLLGADVAVVSYVRLVQQVDSSGEACTCRFEETRVWHRKNECWKHVHFHRSANA
ncbi:MAG: nuclear transport factor 2 family protein [Fuerstiella sp.]|nr:nuclear transport factor 2 family protein [Fuerstiella sp.]